LLKGGNSIANELANLAPVPIGFAARPHPRFQQLTQCQDYELGDDCEVPTPQSPRLLQETKQPFKPATAHPAWRLLLDAGEKVECRTHPDQNRCIEATHMGCHPEFLLRCAEANPYDIRLCGIDLGDDSVILFRRQGAERRRERSHDFQLPG
jgi:hypothetical protein